MDCEDLCACMMCGALCGACCAAADDDNRRRQGPYVVETVQPVYVQQGQYVQGQPMYVQGQPMYAQGQPMYMDQSQPMYGQYVQGQQPMYAQQGQYMQGPPMAQPAPVAGAGYPGSKV
ncbi:hypothetical protein ACHHYP_20443 [Achlya hypogyna]|uniref:Uncharacterized protein n=1 Tax=Achlya hypogyna TaxID=1202772 RepID=A0A1V9ZIQ4_ACHHY|nr:hypothetical protein ACHHYP_20443 [Achlya hypogyna]